MRIKFQAADKCQEYWCYVCYERANTFEADPHVTHDSSSDSESISSSVPSCGEDIPLAEHGQSDQEDAHSLGSWYKADCQSVLSWETTSNASFQMAWEKLDMDDDETSSNASFQMIDHQQQHQHEQGEPEGDLISSDLMENLKGSSTSKNSHQSSKSSNSSSCNQRCSWVHGRKMMN